MKKRPDVNVFTTEAWFTPRMRTLGILDTFVFLCAKVKIAELGPIARLRPQPRTCVRRKSQDNNNKIIQEKIRKKTKNHVKKY